MGPLPDNDYNSLQLLNSFAAFNLEIWVLALVIGIVVVCLVFSAFFSATETALSTSNTIRLRRYVEEGKRGAKKALILIENYDRTITSILIGNNLVNIGASTASAFIFTNLIINPSLASLISTVVMTLIIITFAEILPKTAAKANATEISLKISGLMWFFYKIFYPIAFFYTKLATKNSKNGDSEEQTVTEEELETIIETMEEQGVFDEDHADIIQGAVSLGLKKVSEIMTPRVDTAAVEINDSVEDVFELFLETQFSRLPVYEENKDNIIGVLQVKDFLPAMVKATDYNKLKIRDLMVEPLFVSKQMKVDDLIKIMQDEKKHFAIVSDEYGGTSGVVTMEDALEELVGEIYDEYDYDEVDPFLEETSENHYYLSADLDLKELYQELDVGQPPTGKYSTVGSFIYELFEGLPKVGDKVEVTSTKTIFDDNEFIDYKYLLTFTLKAVENRRIRELDLAIEDITNRETHSEVIKDENEN